MSDSNELITRLQEISALAAFNNWLNLEVLDASPGQVELAIRWRSELGQYSGYLHAGIIGALIDTACGFAAATLSERVLASQFSVRCLRPAVAQTFLVRGRVVKPGKQQIFAAAELFGTEVGKEKLLATGDAILVPVA